MVLMLFSVKDLRWKMLLSGLNITSNGYFGLNTMLIRNECSNAIRVSYRTKISRIRWLTRKVHMKRTKSTRRENQFWNGFFQDRMEPITGLVMKHILLEVNKNKFDDQSPFENCKFFHPFSL